MACLYRVPSCWEINCAQRGCFFWGASISMEISEAPIAPTASHLPIFPSIPCDAPNHGTPWPRPFHCLVYLSCQQTRIDSMMGHIPKRHPKDHGNWDRRTRNSGKKDPTKLGQSRCCLFFGRDWFSYYDHDNNYENSMCNKRTLLPVHVQTHL